MEFSLDVRNKQVFCVALRRSAGVCSAEILQELKEQRAEIGQLRDVIKELLGD